MNFQSQKSKSFSKEQPSKNVQQKSIYSVLVFILPSVICKLLNNATILVNIWWSRTHQILLIGMGVATLFSFTFGYMIIIGLNTGLAYEISRKKNKPEKIGIFYQRALLVNFLICAVLITPLLYFSKRIVVLYDHIDENTAKIISEYLFQLLPSIYCFAYFDTTQTFLQNQGHILGPLIIQIVSVFMHMFLISHIGAAWSKNFTDIFCCIAVYVYIKLLDKPLQSWVQWTIKCVKGWGTHWKFLEIIGITTYIQTLFFFFFSLSAYRIPEDDLICHMSFINLMQIVKLIFLGIKVGRLSKMGYQVKQNDLKSTKKQAQLSIKIIIGCGIMMILLIVIYQKSIEQFFIRDVEGQIEFSNYYWMLVVTITLNSFHAGISSLVKALQKDFSSLKLNVTSYVIALFIANVLCYNYHYGMQGLWIGWNLGIILNTLCCLYVLIKKYKEIFIQQKKERIQKLTAHRLLKQKNKKGNAESIQMQQLESPKFEKTKFLETIRETQQNQTPTLKTSKSIDKQGKQK